MKWQASPNSVLFIYLRLLEFDIAAERRWRLTYPAMIWCLPIRLCHLCLDPTYYRRIAQPDERRTIGGRDSPCTNDSLSTMLCSEARWTYQH